MDEIKIISDEGKGRPFIIVHEDSAYFDFCVSIAKALGERTRAIHLQSSIVQASNWQNLTRLLREKLTALSIRQASFVGFGAANALVQNISFEDLRFVRTVVFVDATSRTHPSRFSRFIDQIEQRLPLGLPMRQKTKDFDAKPYLQRIRCPALVVTTQHATAHMRAEAEILEAKLPTSWRLDLTDGNTAEELATSILDFQEVPARCPQKRVGEMRSVP